MPTKTHHGTKTHHALEHPIATTVQEAAKLHALGCPDCLEMRKNGQEPNKWVHLRQCTECGHIGCCDDSPNTHARHHHDSTAHPEIVSLEPGDDLWKFNYDKDSDF